jgi:putative transposase
MRPVEHRAHKGLNNRAENSDQPTQQRERAMKGFRSPGAAQRFLSASSGISPHFRPRRHLMTAPEHRLEMTIRFTIWDQITGAVGQPPRSEHRPGPRATCPDAPPDIQTSNNVTAPPGP